MNLTHLVCLICAILASVGAINWLAVAYGYNLVESLTGKGTDLTKLVYVLVGVAGVITLGCQVKWALMPGFNK